jgi:voltage-gated potassium channel
MVAAVAFLFAYAFPILFPRLDHDLIEICRVTTWVTWVLFTLDYFVRLAAAEDRRRYVLRHLLDLVIIALPLLRPLRVLRLVSLLRVLNRGAASTLRGRLAVYVAGGAILLAFCGALAVLDAERGKPGANISTFGDAFWWAISTMTTVGYGDRFPVTDEGRVAAVALMIGGVAVLGLVTATLASWLVERVSDAEQEQTEDLRTEIRELHDQLDVLINHIRTNQDNAFEQGQRTEEQYR